jgi:toxin ParE1/3/4
MKRYRIVFTPEALRDINRLYDWTRINASPMTASRFIDGLEAYIRTLDTFPFRGTSREDIGPGARTVPYKRTHMIAFLHHTGFTRTIRFFPT